MVHIDVNDEIYLELETPLDMDQIVSLIKGNQDHLRTFVPHVLMSIDPDQARESFKKRCRGLAAGTRYDYKMMYRGEAVGEIMAVRRKEKPLTFEIGYWIAAKAQGRGITGKCTGALERFCFDSLGAAKTEILCVEENHASSRIAEKNGYTLEGTLLWFGELEGVRHNFRSYGKTEELR